VNGGMAVFLLEAVEVVLIVLMLVGVVIIF